jgi:hypothetical protein
MGNDKPFSPIVHRRQRRHFPRIMRGMCLRLVKLEKP